MRRFITLHPRYFVLSLGMALAASLAAPAARADTSNFWDGNWHGNIQPYVWLPGISAETRYQLPNNGGEVQQKTDNNIFSYLSGAFMLDGTVRKGDWGMYGDIDWVKFSGEKGRFTNIGGDRIGAGANLDTRWGMKGGMVNFAGLYTLAHTGQGFIDLLFGVRYLWVKGNLDWDFSLNGNAGNVNIDRSGHLNNQMHVTDAIIGIRGNWSPFEDKRWFFPYYLDFGAGSSDTTYKASFGVAYGFDWGDIGFSYRDIHYSHSGNDKFIKDLTLSGPNFSVNWNF